MMIYLGTKTKIMKKFRLSVKPNQGWYLSEAMEADGKLDVGNWAVQLLYNSPWW